MSDAVEIDTARHHDALDRAGQSYAIALAAASRDAEYVALDALAGVDNDVSSAVWDAINDSSGDMCIAFVKEYYAADSDIARADAICEFLNTSERTATGAALRKMLANEGWEQ